MTAKWEKEFPNDDKLIMALFALLLVLALRDGRGDATIPAGGDSGGELRPVFQVLVCSDLSPEQVSH